MDTFDRKKMLEELYQEKKKLKELLEKYTIQIEDLSEKPTESQIAKLLEQKKIRRMLQNINTQIKYLRNGEERPVKKIRLRTGKDDPL